MAMEEPTSEDRDELERKLAQVKRLLCRRWDDLTQQRFLTLEADLADRLKRFDRRTQ